MTAHTSPTTRQIRRLRWQATSIEAELADEDPELPTEAERVEHQTGGAL